MKNHCIDNLTEINALILKLSPDQYCHQSEYLYGATIGQHVRHILEFYDQLLSNYALQTINYDSRERKKIVETNAFEAFLYVNAIINLLKDSKICDQDFIFESDSLGSPIAMKTSFNRELFYCLEHSTHHQALIKVSLKEQSISTMVPENFGVAKSTIKFNQQQLCTA